MRNVIPLTGIQRLVGRRMLRSKRRKPCCYVEAVADVTGLLAMRPVLKRKFGIKVTTSAFYIFALSRAAVEFPLVLGRLEGGHIDIAGSANVGFAVNASQGLVVPVIHAAHLKSLVEIASLEKALTDKARANRLVLEDMEGETIALSNLGVYGVDSFLGIVPPPTTVILAVGNIVGRAVSRGGGVAVRKTVALSVAADHRVVNGVYAARFLGCVKRLLEDPQALS
jgi:pyruvate dehydrogenase E2 component (dihydrolipoamide acetyltransferase)